MSQSSPNAVAAPAGRPADPAVSLPWSDPYPGYARLRAETPVFYSESWRGWYLTRYKDISSILREPRVSSQRADRMLNGLSAEEREGVKSGLRNLRSWILMLDPPEHTRLRQLITKAFTARHIETMRPRIQKLVDELLTQMEPSGRMDVIADFANLVPIRVIGDMLGTRPEDSVRLKRWSDGIAEFIGGRRLTTTVTHFIESMSELDAYFRSCIAARRKDPGSDLLSLLLTAEEQGKILDEHEIIATCTMLLFGGHETTTNLIGNAVHALLQHPSALAEFRSTSAVHGPAVEEFLRYDSPVQLVGRLAMEDLEVSGTQIKKGEMIYLSLGAANRDPEQFPEPDRLDFHRAENRHLSFGYSVHFCVGAALARLEGQLALEGLFRHFPQIERVQKDAQWSNNLVLRGQSALPIVMRRSE